MANFTKDEGQISDWQELGDTVTDANSGVSATITKATELEVKILVTLAHVDANDAAANYVVFNLEGKSGAGVTGQDWRLLRSFQGGGGQAVTQALNAESASGQKEVQVAATTDWDDADSGKRLILYNVGAFGDSEVVEIDFWDDADHYTMMDNLENTHDAGDGDALYGGLNEIIITIPAGVETSRIVAHNLDNDANYIWRVDYFDVQSVG